MSDMYFRSLLGKSRRLLGRMRLSETTGQSAGTYGLLALRLERDLARVAGKGRSVLVSGADEDAAAVEAAVELAWSLADELGHPVLLVDAGFGNGSLSAALGMDDRPGLAECLQSSPGSPLTLQPRVLPTRHPRVSVLPHGIDREVTIRAEAIRALLAAACEHYDFVLVQGSILTDAERTLAFGSLVDAAMLFAVEENSTLDDLARGQRLLQDCGARRVALVLGNRMSAGPTPEP